MTPINMKWTIRLILLAAIAAPAVERKPGKPPAPAAGKLAPPKDARQIDANHYSFTDPRGQKWIYTKTPFGWSRFEDKPAEAATVPEGMTAVEDGDVIRFERSGPFGVYRWQKKKTELDPIEAAACKQAREKSAAKTKPE